MDFFKQLNQKLEEGYKMTTSSCDICNKTLLFDTKQQLFLCVKCNKTYPVLIEQDEQSEQKDDQQQEQKHDYHEEYQQVSKQLETKPDYSKQLSQKLIQGWTMLEECCPDCLIPIMQKNKSKLCVGCQNAYLNKQSNPQPQNQQQQQSQSSNIQQKQKQSNQSNNQQQQQQQQSNAQLEQSQQSIVSQGQQNQEQIKNDNKNKKQMKMKRNQRIQQKIDKIINKQLDLVYEQLERQQDVQQSVVQLEKVMGLLQKLGNI